MSGRLTRPVTPRVQPSWLTHRDDQSGVDPVEVGVGGDERRRTPGLDTGGDRRERAGGAGQDDLEALGDGDRPALEPAAHSPDGDRGTGQSGGEAQEATTVGAGTRDDRRLGGRPPTCRLVDVGMLAVLDVLDVGMLDIGMLDVGMLSCDERRGANPLRAQRCWDRRRRRPRLGRSTGDEDQHRPGHQAGHDGRERTGPPTAASPERRKHADPGEQAHTEQARSDRPAKCDHPDDGGEHRQQHCDTGEEDRLVVGAEGVDRPRLDRDGDGVDHPVAHRGDRSAQAGVEPGDQLAQRDPAPSGDEAGERAGPPRGR